MAQIGKLVKYFSKTAYLKCTFPWLFYKRVPIFFLPEGFAILKTNVCVKKDLEEKIVNWKNVLIDVVPDSAITKLICVSAQEASKDPNARKRIRVRFSVTYLL